MNDDTRRPQTNDDTDGTNLGDTLRAARVARDLSQDDLARGLRLEPRIIRQLENNQFDQLPAPAFTRGYVRAIAKELGIDSAPLIAILDSRFASEPPPLADFESRAPAQITSDSTIIRYSSLALVALMVILVALWWRSHDGTLTLVDERPEPEPAQTPATPPLDYEYTTIEHPQQPFYTAPAPAGEPDLPAADTTTDGTDTAGSDTLAASGQTAGEIVIVTTKDVWVEVRDSLGARLYYDLIRAGREVRLSSRPPYSVTIGNSSAATVRYNGEPVPLAPFANEGVARFELGREGAPATGTPRE